MKNTVIEMARIGIVFVHDIRAGQIIEQDDGNYVFLYDEAYLASKNCTPVSLTLPLLKTSYESKTLFPFFDGLIPEGWLLEIAEKNWKMDRRDRMGLLLEVCGDCIGAVHIEKSPDATE